MSICMEDVAGQFSQYVWCRLTMHAQPIQHMRQIREGFIITI